MTRATLTEQIDSISFTEDAAALYLDLVSASATDEKGAVVLVAAATILASEHLGARTADDVALARLGAEFIQMIFAVRNERLQQRRELPLRVVAGTDA